MVVSLSRRPDRVDAGTIRSALARAGFDAASGRVVQAVLTSGDDLIFSTRVARQELSLPVLEACLQRLRDLQHASP